MRQINLTDDPKWVRRALSYFDGCDRDQNGVVTIHQIQQWAECMREMCQATDEKIEMLKDRLGEVYGDVGFTSDGMKREDFPSYLSSFAQRERERKRKKQETFHGRLMDALFDVIDSNNDNHISLDEMKIRMKATGMPEESAKFYLEMADTNKNGTVEREELDLIEFRFWFEPIDESLDNLYGGHFSGNLPIEIQDLTSDPKWVRRALSYFDACDRDQDGVVTIHQIQEWAECMREPCQASDDKIEMLKDRLREVYGDVGFTTRGMKRENFPKNLNGFAQRERERKSKREKTYHGSLMDALFDVIDVNNDNHISLDEMKLRMKAIGMPEESAKYYIEMADTNQNGTIERDELDEIEFRFWFEPIDESLDNLYGGHFSGNLPKDEINLTDDPKWVRRALSYFDGCDRDQNGVVTIHQIQQWAECMREMCQATDEKIEMLKGRLGEVYGDVGFTSEGMNRKDFPKCLNGFAKRERERKVMNQSTFHGRLMDALFDVIDSNNDNHISLDEMKIRMKAIGMPEESAKFYLEMADTNKNGTVEREELDLIEFRFWFEPIDESLDNLYGGHFSGNSQ